MRGRLRVLWCQVTLRHRGWVVVVGYPPRPYWLCDHCGETR